MLASTIINQGIAELHQRDLRAAAAQARLSKEACSTMVVGSGSHAERIAPLQTLKTLTLSFLLSPRAAAAVAAAVAIVASVVFGTDSASAVGAIHGGH